MKKYDVTAIGELLIDFTVNGISNQGNPLFEANPGGAPCNVLAMLNKCGKTTQFIGKVGRDQFGTLLADTLKEQGIGREGLFFDSVYNTTLAFVKTFENGDRDFSFYRKPGADMLLTKEEVESVKEMIEDSSIFHFGTLSMTHEGVMEATKRAIELAKKSGAILSFDPNLRPPLWDSLEHAKEAIRYGLSQCDVLKISEEELEFMTGVSEIREGVKLLWEQFPNIILFNVTAGADGSYSFYKELESFVPGCQLGNVIETTGAGDTFCGSILYYLLEHDIAKLTQEDLTNMLTFANAAAYLVTTKKGAIRSMPELSDVEKIMKTMAM